ncbi:MAG: sulfurtransferase TusA family protein [Methylococcaceae bacterium]|nr:MAG: sulfurtransferase TusA family protein [Methylococcaceae bacterium]
MNEETLDVRGLLCPMPVIRTQNRVKTLAAGQRLEVVGSDPGMLSDIPAWCRINGHRLLDSRRDGGNIVVVLEVGANG